MISSRIRRALVCAPLPPEHDRESGSRRIHHMIEFLLEAGWSVAFVCENAPAESRHLRELRQRGVATYVGFGGPTADLVEAGAFDLAIFAFWYLADRHADLVRQLSPATRILVESVDLHWLRNTRRILDRRGGGESLSGGDLGRDLVGELNAYGRADAVLTVSAREASFVNDILGETALAHAVADCDDTAPSTVPFDERKGILFVGNFRHPPNLDGVRYLCEEVLPLLPVELRREHPLTIVGNGLDESVMKATEGCPDVRLVGWVPSLVPYLHTARATVVPLRYGAGTKRKLIQALLARTPSVSTPAGVEGLDLRDGAHVLVGRDAPSLAAALERVTSDRDLWHRLARQGRRQTLRLHGRAAARTNFLRVLDEVTARPPRAAPMPSAGGATVRRQGGPEAVRRVVDTALPADANVLVVSKGDPDLVRLPGRRAGHFPQTPDGRYAGFHPRDSPSAIRHLEELGGESEYLVVPAPSFWWLDYYKGFAGHLAKRHEQIWCDEDCIVYRLAKRKGAERGVRAIPAPTAPGAFVPLPASLLTEAPGPARLPDGFSRALR